MSADITQMLAEIEAGESDAADRLFPVVYDQLRRIAGGVFAGERGDHTLEPTALVHEAYIKLVGRAELSFRSRAQFFALAGKVMRCVLVDHARSKNAQKRGGENRREATLSGIGLAPSSDPVDIIALDDALRELEALDERKCRLVELRFFGGLDEKQAAEVLGVARSTVSADWRTARAWLMARIEGNRPEAGR